MPSKEQVKLKKEKYGEAAYKKLVADQVREWNRNNPDKAKETRRKWDVKHRNEYQKQYRIKHKQKRYKMKHNVGKYREVDKLPDDALTPKLYAEQNDISHQLVYVRLKRAREKGLFLDYEMITFQGANYIVPYRDLQREQGWELDRLSKAELKMYNKIKSKFPATKHETVIEMVKQNI